MKPGVDVFSSHRWRLKPPPQYVASYHTINPQTPSRVHAFSDRTSPKILLSLSFPADTFAALVHFPSIA